MILTEDEAKVTACPETLAKTPYHNNCRARGCMAWRWMYAPEPEEVEPRGYCGKAGRPSP